MVWAYRRAFEHVVDPPGSNAVAGTRMTPVIGDGPWGEADYTQQVMLVVFTANVVAGVSDSGGFLSPYPGPGPIRTILVEEEVSAEIDW